jgi:hypothetical protein
MVDSFLGVLMVCALSAAGSSSLSGRRFGPGRLADLHRRPDAYISGLP